MSAISAALLEQLLNFDSTENCDLTGKFPNIKVGSLDGNDVQSVIHQVRKVAEASSTAQINAIVQRDKHGDAEFKGLRVTSLSINGATIDPVYEATANTILLRGPDGDGKLQKLFTNTIVVNSGTDLTLGASTTTVKVPGILEVGKVEVNSVSENKKFILNNGGAANTSGKAGIYIEEDSVEDKGYMRQSADRTKFEFKLTTAADPFYMDQSVDKAATIQAAAFLFDSSTTTAAGPVTYKAKLAPSPVVSADPAYDYTWLMPKTSAPANSLLSIPSALASGTQSIAYQTYSSAAEASTIAMRDANGNLVSKGFALVNAKPKTCTLAYGNESGTTGSENMILELPNMKTSNTFVKGSILTVASVVPATTDASGVTTPIQIKTDFLSEIAFEGSSNLFRANDSSITLSTRLPPVAPATVGSFVTRNLLSPGLIELFPDTAGDKSKLSSSALGIQSSDTNVSVSLSKSDLTLTDKLKKTESKVDSEALRFYAIDQSTPASSAVNGVTAMFGANQWGVQSVQAMPSANDTQSAEVRMIPHSFITTPSGPVPFGGKGYGLLFNSDNAWSLGTIGSTEISDAVAKAKVAHLVSFTKTANEPVANAQVDDLVLCSKRVLIATNSTSAEHKANVYVDTDNQLHASDFVFVPPVAANSADGYLDAQSNAYFRGNHYQLYNSSLIYLSLKLATTSADPSRVALHTLTLPDWYPSVDTNEAADLRYFLGAKPTTLNGNSLLAEWETTSNMYVASRDSLVRRKGGAIGVGSLKLQSNSRLATATIDPPSVEMLADASMTADYKLQLPATDVATDATKIYLLSASYDSTKSLTKLGYTTPSKLPSNSDVVQRDAGTIKSKKLYLANDDADTNYMTFSLAAAPATTNKLNYTFPNSLPSKDGILTVASFTADASDSTLASVVLDFKNSVSLRSGDIATNIDSGGLAFVEYDTSPHTSSPNFSQEVTKYTRDAFYMNSVKVNGPALNDSLVPQVGLVPNIAPDSTKASTKGYGLLFNQDNPWTIGVVVSTGSLPSPSTGDVTPMITFIPADDFKTNGSKKNDLLIKDTLFSSNSVRSSSFQLYNDNATPNSLSVKLSDATLDASAINTTDLTLPRAYTKFQSYETGNMSLYMDVAASTGVLTGTWSTISSLTYKDRDSVVRRSGGNIGVTSLTLQNKAVDTAGTDATYKTLQLKYENLSPPVNNLVYTFADAQAEQGSLLTVASVSAADENDLTLKFMNSIRLKTSNNQIDIDSSGVVCYSVDTDIDTNPSSTATQTFTSSEFKSHHLLFNHLKPKADAPDVLSSGFRTVSYDLFYPAADTANKPVFKEGYGLMFNQDKPWSIGTMLSTCTDSNLNSTSDTFNEKIVYFGKIGLTSSSTPPQAFDKTCLQGAIPGDLGIRSGTGTLWLAGDNQSTHTIPGSAIHAPNVFVSTHNVFSAADFYFNPATSAPTEQKITAAYSGKNMGLSPSDLVFRHITDKNESTLSAKSVVFYSIDNSPSATPGAIANLRSSELTGDHLLFNTTTTKPSALDDVLSAMRTINYASLPTMNTTPNFQAGFGLMFNEEKSWSIGNMKPTCNDTSVDKAETFNEKIVYFGASASFTTACITGAASGDLGLRNTEGKIWLAGGNKTPAKYSPNVFVTKDNELNAASFQFLADTNPTLLIPSDTSNNNGQITFTTTYGSPTATVSKLNIRMDNLGQAGNFYSLCLPRKVVIPSLPTSHSNYSGQLLTFNRVSGSGTSGDIAVYNGSWIHAATCYDNQDTSNPTFVTRSTSGEIGVASLVLQKAVDVITGTSTITQSVRVALKASQATDAVNYELHFPKKSATTKAGFLKAIETNASQLKLEVTGYEASVTDIADDLVLRANDGHIEVAKYIQMTTAGASACTQSIAVSDALTEDAIITLPVSTPAVGKVLKVVSVSGNNAVLDYADESGGGGASGVYAPDANTIVKRGPDGDIQAKKAVTIFQPGSANPVSLIPNPSETNDKPVELHLFNYNAKHSIGNVLTIDPDHTDAGKSKYLIKPTPNLFNLNLIRLTDATTTASTTITPSTLVNNLQFICSIQVGVGANLSSNIKPVFIVTLRNVLQYVKSSTNQRATREIIFKVDMESRFRQVVGYHYVMPYEDNTNSLIGCPDNYMLVVQVTGIAASPYECYLYRLPNGASATDISANLPFSTNPLTLTGVSSYTSNDFSVEITCKTNGKLVLITSGVDTTMPAANIPAQDFSNWKYNGDRFRFDQLYQKHIADRELTAAPADVFYWMYTPSTVPEKTYYIPAVMTIRQSDTEVIFSFGQTVFSKVTEFDTFILKFKLSGGSELEFSTRSTQKISVRPFIVSTDAGMQTAILYFTYNSVLGLHQLVLEPPPGGWKTATTVALNNGYDVSFPKRGNCDPF